MEKDYLILIKIERGPLSDHAVRAAHQQVGSVKDEQSFIRWKWCVQDQSQAGPEGISKQHMGKAQNPSASGPLLIPRATWKWASF